MGEGELKLNRDVLSTYLIYKLWKTMSDLNNITTYLQQTQI